MNPSPNQNQLRIYTIIAEQSQLRQLIKLTEMESLTQITEHSNQ